MVTKENFEVMKQFANQAVDSLNKAVCAFNFVEMAKEKLLQSGFVQIYETDPWNFKPGDKLFYTRNNSCIIAFTVGKEYNDKTGCFKIIGAHTDSPSLRIAPNSYNPSEGLERYNIQTYGGGLWFTWFDRDLSVAGKVVYKNDKGQLESAIIKCDEPIFVIPNLPPHLKNDRLKLEWNNETQLKPLLATTLVSSLFQENKEVQKDKKLGPVLRTVILKELKKVTKANVKEEDIVDYDLCLYDTQPSKLIGLNGEFLASQRLDNQGSSVPAVFSIIEAAKDEVLAKQTSINIIALFDNEEIGSMTFQGADANFFYTHLKRMYYQTAGKDAAAKTEDGFLAMCARSFSLSADLAHAYNPNFAEKFQAQHRNLIQEGVVIKINANGRYASDSEGGAIVKEIAKKCGCPIQEFIVRQDSPCGTTIGPIITSKIGIRSVDIGIPQFAMHSIREVLGICDLYNYKNLFVEFFKSYEEAKGQLLKA